MTNKTNTLKILSMMVAITLVSMPVMTNAQITPGEDCRTTLPSRTNHTIIPDAALDKKIDDVGFATLQLQLQNQYLSQFPTNETAQNMIKYNDQEIERLLAKIVELWPPTSTVDIPASDRERMSKAIPKLVASGLPVIEVGINSYTGMLDVVIDIDRCTPDMEQKIREIAPDVQLNITYGKNNAVFQSNSTDLTSGSESWTALAFFFPSFLVIHLIELSDTVLHY